MDQVRSAMARPFTRLVWAQAINRFGDGFFSIGVTWLIYTSTHSVTLLGFLWAAYFLLVAGLTSVLAPVVDRFERRLLAAVLNLLQAIVVFAPLLLAILGWFHLWELYPTFLLLGLVGIPSGSAVSALVPALTAPENLVAANAELYGATQAMYLVGPAVGGMFLAVFGPLSGLAVDGGTFLVAAALLLTLPRSEGHILARREPYWATFRSGARLLWRQARLRLLASLSIIVSATDVAFVVLSVPLVVSVLHGTTAGVGFLEGSLSAGFLLGAWWVRRGALRHWPMARWALVIVFCVATGVIALIPLLLWALLTQVVAGVASAVFQVEWDAAFQSGVPSEELGRVLMWQRGAARLASVAAAVLLALVAARVGVPMAFLALGILGAGIAVWVLANLARWDRRERADAVFESAP